MKIINIWKRLKTYTKIASIIIVILVIWGLFNIFFQFGKADFQSSHLIDGDQGSGLVKVKVFKGEELKKNSSLISSIGKIEALGQAELKSEVSAKVKAVRVSLGQEVKAGDILVELENDDLAASLLQAEAALEIEEAALKELIRGARPEQLSLAQNQLNNAEESFKEISAQVEANLNNAYSIALSTLQSSVDTARNALVSLTDLQSLYLYANTEKNLQVAVAKGAAVSALFDQSGGNWWGVEAVRQADSGVFKEIKEITSSKDREEIDQALVSLKPALEATREFISRMISASDNFSSTNKATLSSQQTSVNAQIASVFSAEQSVALQKSAGESLIRGAQTALDNAKDNLSIILAGASDEQIDLQTARVKAARGKLAQTKVLFNKTIIKSPISGKIGNLYARQGELLNPGGLAVSVINNKGWIIKAFVDSNSLFNIAIGNKVLIENKFEGKVIEIASSIDPLTKKVELKVDVLEDEKTQFVVGEFVNLEIAANQSEEESVYLIPLGMVKVQSDKYQIYTANEENIIEIVDVKVGEIVGEKIEILSGLENDTKVVETSFSLENGQEVEILD